MSAALVLEELKHTLELINISIAEVERKAAEMGCPAVLLEYSDRRPGLAQLAVAKAEVLHSIVVLESRRPMIINNPPYPRSPGSW